MVFKSGPDHFNWKGGKTKDNKGYVKTQCKGHRKADSHGRIKEHRLVYEQYYNCCLLDWVDIHHINGIKDDNRIENLEPISHGTHTSNHIKGNQYWLGKNHTEETKEKMSKVKIGKVFSQETRRKMSENQWKRRRSQI